MIDGAFARPDAAIQASAALVGVAACLSSLEWLRLRRDFAEGGCFAWSLTGSRRLLLRHPAAERALSFLFEPPGVLVLLGVRALSAVFLSVAAIAGSELLVPLAILALTGALLGYRQLYGLDGSDQMTLVILMALAIGTAAGAERLAVAFIGAQAVAAYFIAGAAKLRGLDWRRGEAVPLILSTRSYGVPRLGALLSERPIIGRGVTWSAMSFECLFPLALFGPELVLFGFLLAGGLFHVAAAVTMGLNVFPWAFLAAYPCVVYLSQQL